LIFFLNEKREVFSDEEEPGNSAVCHVELARVYSKTGNPLQQRVHQLESARLFYLAKFSRFHMKMTGIA
jgi:hypothetical protein